MKKVGGCDAGGNCGAAEQAVDRAVPARIAVIAVGGVEPAAPRRAIRALRGAELGGDSSRLAIEAR